MKIVLYIRPQRPLLIREHSIDGLRILGRLLSRTIRGSADNESHDVFGLDGFTLGHEFESDLDGGHGGRVRVFLGRFAELGVDRVVQGWNGVFAHVSAEGAEVAVDLRDNGFGVLAGEDVGEEFAGGGVRSV